MDIYNLHEFTDAPIGDHDIMGAAPFVELSSPVGGSFFNAIVGGANMQHLMRNPVVRRRRVVETACWMIGGLILGAIETYQEGGAR